MTTLTTAWMLGCVCGFFLGVTVAGRRRGMQNPAGWARHVMAARSLRAGKQRMHA